MAGVITKSELAESYGMTTRTLSKLLNDRYFVELSAVGYLKNSVYLSPRVLNKFYELYGNPLNESYEE